MLPAADRVKYHIDKKGQNYIDKEALTKWMEEAAVASQIGHDYIPFVKEAKGEDSVLSIFVKNLQLNLSVLNLCRRIVIILLKLCRKEVCKGRREEG